jgi:hypothetical protein
MTAKLTEGLSGMNAVSQGAIVGVVNESGLNHRSVGAAFIAVSGLNGRGVTWLGADEQGPRFLPVTACSTP